MKLELPEMALGAFIVYALMTRKLAQVEGVIPKEEEAMPETKPTRPIRKKPARTTPYGFLTGIDRPLWGPPTHAGVSTKVPSVTPEQKKIIHEIDP